MLPSMIQKQLLKIKAYVHLNNLNHLILLFFYLRFFLLLKYYLHHTQQVHYILMKEF